MALPRRIRRDLHISAETHRRDRTGLGRIREIAPSDGTLRNRGNMHIQIMTLHNVPVAMDRHTPVLVRGSSTRRNLALQVITLPMAREGI